MSFAIISFFKKTTAESNYIYSKVNTGDWVKYLSMKLFNLKEMINFYKIDPMKTSTKILKEFREIAKQIKENQQREDKTYNSHENKLNASSEDPQIVIQNLIKPVVNVLIYLFSLYVIYAYSFILIFNSSKSDLVLTSKFASEYLQVDKAIMN